MNATMATRAAAVALADRKAEALVARVREGLVDADALALEIAPLYGFKLQAMARAIAKALVERSAA
jgi:hypothetical protein